MKYLFQLLLLIGTLQAAAQTTAHHNRFRSSYLSIAPFILLEPHMAPGLGYSHKWTEHSSVFAEGAYLLPNPIYDLSISLHGFRFIGQYRYHFDGSLGVMRGFLGSLLNKEESFVALEARLKHYTFSQTANFYNAANNTRLENYPYTASATVYGSAVLFGNIFSLDNDEKFLVEFSVGLGVKQKLVAFQNVPPGFSLVKQDKIEWGFVPTIEEEVRTAYVPFAIRLQYHLH